jgi:hypothetical protein
MAGAAAEEASTFAGGFAISSKEAAGVPLAGGWPQSLFSFVHGKGRQAVRR